MAKFTAGPGATGGIDFTDFDDLLLVDDEGTPTVTDATRHVRQVAPDDLNEFQGTGFKYSPAGDLISGTLKTVFTGDSLSDVWRLSDFSMSVATANKLLDGADPQAFLASVLSKNDEITGTAFNDHLIGYKGNDTIVGGGGADTLDGDVGNDSLVGDGGDDKLFGGAGNDTLDGGAGNDSMDGGAGNDVYVVDSIVDKITETDANSKTGGIDTVLSHVFAYTLTPGSNIENLTLAEGSAAEIGTGNDLANVITGNSLDNTLNGLDGNDKLFGNGGDDTLSGTAGNDTLDGGDGNDSLVGGDGADSMVGGFGDDTYSVDDAKDKVSEKIANAKGGGHDTVESSISYTLGANLDDLILTGGLGNSGTGNAEHNQIFGNGANNKLSGLAGNDTLLANGGDDTLDGGVGNDSLVGGIGNDSLIGGAGDDTMVGGKGDDIYVLDSPNDLIVESDGEGADTVQAPFDIDLGDDKFKNVENATLLGKALTATGTDGANWLTGNASANTLTGLDGNDTLDGGKGNDTLIGGKGDDLYIVDSVKDFVDETGGGGVDTVRSSINVNLALFAGVEHIELTGKSALNATGNGLDNKITGNDGNNVLDGGIGADTMKGGLGNDTYIVDNIGDVTSEEGGGGIDTVFSGVTWELDPDFENLVLTGSDNIDGFGNNFANKITGNAGNNLLSGGLGADTMIGGAGDDTYVVNLSTDQVIETLSKEKGGGIDTVHSAASFVLGNNVDHLVLTGDNASTGTGNTLANEITGNGAANVLLGMAGNDSLIGNGGNDTLDGGAGDDTMDGGAGDDVYFVDSVKDVVLPDSAGVDTIVSKITQDISGRLDIENVVLVSGAINATGNSLDNLLIGSTGANILDGGGGNDTMEGGRGNDTYHVDSTNIIDGKFVNGAGDITFEEIRIGGGTDTVLSTVDHQLLGHIERLTLVEGSKAVQGWGNTERNLIVGNSNDNVLLGNENADTLIGGDGNDSLHGGNDNVFNDSLDGGEGNDTLDGGKGPDRMNGGAGDDTYFVDNPGDRITDTSGIDTVKSTISYTLGATLEHLELLGFIDDHINGTGNASDNSIKGNAGNNKLVGLAGNDTLDGGEGFGDDTLIGGAGDDVLIGGNGVDVAVFTGKQADYKITPVDPDKGEFIVEDLRTTAKNEGKDTLFGIETMQFADGVIAQNQPPGIGNLSSTKIFENTVGGTVGTFVVSDPNNDEIASVTVNDPRFEIVKNGVDYQLKLRAGESLDFEDKASFDVVISAEDPFGADSEKIVTISVQDFPTAAGVDGYIAGATAFSDINGNGVMDAGESSTATLTDIIGRLELRPASPMAVTGGTDIATGLDFLGTLRAQAGATAITPLTTLVVAMAQAGVSSPQTALLNVFGFALPGAATVNTYDPVAGLVATQNAGTRRAAGVSAEIYNTAVMAASFIVAFNDGDVTFDEAFAQAFASLAGQIALGAAVDLTDAAFIADLLVSIDAEIGNAMLSLSEDELEGASAVIAALNEAIDDFAASPSVTAAALLAQIAAANIVAQTDAVDALESLGSGGSPNLTPFTNEAQLANLITAALDDVGTVAFKLTTGTTGDNTTTLTDNAEAYDGLGGNDTVNGKGGNDTLFGGAGNDKIDGGAGNDSLVGGWGNDTFIGGDGTDTVIYDGKFAEYILSGESGDVTVTDKATTISNNDGKDSLSGVEFIQFADKLVVINQAPDITSADKFSVAENTKIVGTVTAIDTNPGDVVTFSISGADAALFNIDSTTGELSFKAAPNFEDPLDAGKDNVYDVIVTAKDKGGLTDEQAVKITVTNVNEAPDITSTAFSMAENNTLAGTVVAVDPDAGDQLTFTITGGVDAALFNIDSKTGALTFKAAPDFETPADDGKNNVYDVIVTATDKGGLADSQAIAVTVTNVNEAPVITSNGGGPTATINVAENTKAVTTVTATDPDAGTTLTYSLVGGADKNLFAIDSSTGALSFIAAPDFETKADSGGNGVYDVIVQASDGTNADTQAIAVTVTNVNEAPVITSNGGGDNAAVNVAENTKAVTTVVATDVDAATTLTYSIAGGADAALFTINASTGALSFIAAPDFETKADNGGNGVYDVIVQASDGTLVDTQSIAITVTNVNEAPVNSVPGAQTINEDTPLTFTGGNAITINDVDAGSNDVQVTLAVTNGTLDIVNIPAGLVVTGDNTANVTLTGTVAEINAGLNGLVFTPTANFNGGATLTVTTNDQGNSGSGGPLTDIDNVTINVTAVNDAPVNSVPGTQTVNEDTSLTFTGGNAITISDVDAGSSDVQVTLAVTNGTLDVINIPAGLVVTGDNSANVTLTGTVAEINAGLNGLVFTPVANFNGGATLTVTTDDKGAAGAGGAKIDTDNITINVTAVNDVPVNTVPGAQTIDEDTTLIFTGAKAISVADIDAGSNDIEVTLAVTSGALDVVNIPAGLDIVGDNTANVTLTGTVAEINAALDGLKFTPVANFNGGVTLTVTTDDLGNTGTGGSKIDTDNVTINVTAVNDAPVNSVPGTQTLNEDTSLTFTGGNAITISDVDAGSSDVQVTLAVTGGALDVVNIPAGLIVTGDNSANVTLTGTVAEINAGLNGLVFTPAVNFNGAVTLTVTTNDQGATGTGGTKSDTDNVTINVTAVNDAPVNSVPGTQTINEDTTLTLTGAKAISIADIDAGSNDIEVTLAVTSGALDVINIPAGLDIVGDNTANVTLTGTVAEINAALEGLKFAPAANFNGAVTLTVTTDDLGNTGTGGSKIDADNVTINVTAVNDAPVNSVPGTQTINEDATLTFTGGNAITISDVDAGSNDVQVTLAVTNGTLDVVNIPGGLVVTGDNSNNVTLTGTVAEINAGLNGLVFTPTANFNGGATLTVTTNDQGNTGTGGPLTDIDNVTINVTAVNDAPVNGVPGVQSTNEDTALTFNTANGNLITVADVDAGSSDIQVTLEVTSGALDVANIPAGLVVTGDNSANVTLTGTVAEINTALNGLVFTPAANFTGEVTLTVTTDDQGATGTGGSKSDVDNITINVADTNDAPVNTVPGTQTIDEDTTLTFTGANAITVADIDAGGNDVKVTLGVTNGKLDVVNIPAGLVVTGDNSSSVTLTGTLTEVNTALDGLKYIPTADFSGAATLTVTTDDQGATGTGGSKSDTDNITINVTAVNDDPVITSSSSASVAENQTGAIDVNATDIDGGPLAYSLLASADKDLFDIDGTSGVITFKNAPDFESPLDDNKDNDYLLTVQVDDGKGGVVTQNITVSVTDVQGEDLTGDGTANKLVGGIGDDTLSGAGGADTLLGGADDDTLSGDAGDDSLDGGSGIDKLSGGADNDTLVWDAADTLIDGGDGTDTLLVPSGNLDLTGVTAITNIERIDLATDTGPNALTLALQDVLDVTGPGGDTLTIDGDTGDTANIGAGWTADSGGPVGGYQTYTQGAATLIVDTDVAVNPP